MRTPPLSTTPEMPSSARVAKLSKRASAQPRPPSAGIQVLVGALEAPREGARGGTVRAVGTLWAHRRDEACGHLLRGGGCRTCCAASRQQVAAVHSEVGGVGVRAELLDACRDGARHRLPQHDEIEKVVANLGGNAGRGVHTERRLQRCARAPELACVVLGLPQFGGSALSLTTKE